MIRFVRIALVASLALFGAAPRVRAGGSIERVDWTQRGKTLSLTIYHPAGPIAKGTVFMAGGDVGWVGLAVTVAQQLAADGYLVVGINVRQYLSIFTVGAAHLTPADVQRDYGDLSRYLNGRGLLNQPVIVSGVSEGAGLAVLAAASA